MLLTRMTHLLLLTRKNHFLLLNIMSVTAAESVELGVAHARNNITTVTSDVNVWVMIILTLKRVGSSD